MSSVSSPYGLEPVGITGSHIDNGGYTELPLTVNNTVGLAMYDLVALVGGSIKLVTATPTTTLSTATPIGVFMGCSYNDPVLGFVNRSILPANAVTNGLINIKVKVADNPSYLFKVQADGSVPASSLGLTAALTNFSSADFVNGISRVKLQSSSVGTTATQAVRIMAFASNPNTVAGDSFTDCIVRFNFGVHAYSQSATQ